MLFSLWKHTPYRVPGDLDLLGYSGAVPERDAAVFHEICRIYVDDDSLIFRLDTLRTEPARTEAKYGGVRIAMTAEIAGALLSIRIDIGFGDAVTLAVEEIDYPSLLDMPVLRLRAYPPETVVAGKFQALVALGIHNSRVKDFFDLWAISETFSFDGTVLAQAIAATFERRRTDIPTDTPIALTSALAEDAAKQAQWQGFLRRTSVTMVPGPFAELQATVAAFILTPVRALVADKSFDETWSAGGLWK